jgi:hypothetical protein
VIDVRGGLTWRIAGIGYSRIMGTAATWCSSCGKSISGSDIVLTAIGAIATSFMGAV